MTQTQKKILKGAGSVTTAALGAILAIFGLLLFISGCSPKIYLVDRHTVLEEEAAGEWPEFERALLEKSTSLGPVPYPKTALTEEQKRLYRILNGELGFHSSVVKKGN